LELSNTILLNLVFRLLTILLDELCPFMSHGMRRER